MWKQKSDSWNTGTILGLQGLQVKVKQKGKLLDY